jgi:hypothetical protein
MSMSDNLRKHDLDCLRLASDLTQLANDVLSPALRSYLPQMARAVPAWLNGQRLGIDSSWLSQFIRRTSRSLISCVAPLYRPEPQLRAAPGRHRTAP